MEVLFNPKAGEGRFGIREKELRERIRKTARAKGVDLKMEVYASTMPHEILSLAEEAVEREVDIIAGAGGDGTTNEVANAIAGTDVALGIIPIGSGNDSLTSIKGNYSVDGAIEDIVTGSPVPMDIGKVNGDHFLNVLGIGLDAEVNHETQRRKHHVKSIGPTASYIWSAVKVIPFYKPKRIRASVDGDDPIDITIMMATVGNGDTCGGGFKITPEARVNDGLLDLSMIEATGKLRSLKKIPTVFKGKHLGMREVHYSKFERMRLESLQGDLVYQIDGEDLKASKFDIELIPDGINIMHPIGH